MSDGLPYVMDANETYSSIAHAAGIHNFGLSDSYGLANEVFSPFADSQPYVHSHQGNYPRIYASILYELGFSDPRSQIIITTFTIGLLSIVFAYNFFCRITTPAFALVCCLVYITDYIFFSQWQIVTYRVWYAFVFFAQFYLIERFLSAEHKSKTFILILLNTALFSYGELVFCGFLGAASLLWLLFRGWNAKKSIALGCLALVVGLAISLILLFLQGVGYLGNENFITDLKITFFSRNDFNSGKIGIAEIAKFYRDNRVIFWENLQYRDSFIGAVPFVKSIVQPFANVHEPYALIFFSLPIVVLATAYGLNKLGIFFRGAKKLQDGSQLASPIIVYLVATILMFSTYLVVAKVIGYFYHQHTWSYANVAAALMIVFTVCFAQNKRNSLFLNFILGSIFVILTSIFLLYLINDQYAPLWNDSSPAYFTAVKVVLVPFLVIGFVLSINQFLALRCQETRNGISNLLVFMVVGLLAYAFIYFLSPGYVYSGYVSRFAPFFVYFADILVGITFYILFEVSIGLYRLIHGSEQRSSILLKFFIVLTLFFTYVIYWFIIQYKSVERFPPTHFEVFDIISKAPFKGSTFVVNNYSAPVATNTESWAYMDALIERGAFVKENDKNYIVGSRKYLWFADNRTNDSYRRPDYFLCLLPQTLDTVTLRFVTTGTNQGCLNSALVKIAMKNLNGNDGLSLVMYDKHGVNVSGVASWAIVKFNWSESTINGILWEDELPPVKFRSP